MTGLNLPQFKAEVVTPTLNAIGLGGEAAVNLLTGTALAESGLVYLRQISGPALGPWQMEPFTETDIWTTFLSNARLSSLTATMQAMLARDIPRTDQLITNMRYACAMARLKYYRAPGPLPAADDAAAQCRYWKSNYNTALGAGAADSQHVALFQQAIEA
ncbi:hypothetical protein [Komagataeibacter rhaeticus]|uniref:hypothetical protein n=1 Tax=Komagataeibacter rhaeticus TaxID=215221 RepID=UPI0039E7986E